jgi:hypothetical protein
VGGHRPGRQGAGGNGHRAHGAQADPRFVAALAVAEPVLCGEVSLDLLSRVVVEIIADADTLRLLGMAAHAVGDPVRAVDFLDRSEAKLREQGRLGLLSHVLTMQVLDRLELGDWERAAAALEEAGRLTADTGQPIWDNVTLADAAINAGLRGDNDRAQALATQAERDASGRNLNCLLACVQLARATVGSALATMPRPTRPCGRCSIRMRRASISPNGSTR